MKIFFSMLLVVLFSSLTACSEPLTKPSQVDRDDIQLLMLKDLEAKYEKEFVVEEFEYQPNTSDYIMHLHLKSDKKIVFFAYLNSETGNSGDSFLMVYWNEEASAQFYPLFYKNFPERPLIKGKPQISISFKNPNVKEKIIKEKHLTLQEIERNYKDSYTLGLQINVVIKDTSVRPSDYQNRIFNIMKEYKSKGVSLKNVSFLFYDDVEKEISKYNLHLLNVKEVDNIKKAEDLDAFWHENF